MRKSLLISIVILFAVTISSATSITVSGNISANTTWDTDTVFVDGDIVIDSSFTLTINPGTTVLFNDFYEILVEGTVLSVGTDIDPIVFTVEDTTGYYNFSHTGWNGFLFDNEFGVLDGVNDTSVFEFTEFYFAKDSYQGGAIRVSYFNKIFINNCTFSYNYADYAGGAISIEYESEFTVEDCEFTYNSVGVDCYGGGAINVGCDNGNFSQPVIRNNYFANNSSLYSLDERYGGGAVKLSGYTSAILANNVFEDNSSLSQGGAIICSGYCTPRVMNNLIINNTSGHNGGAIAIKYYASPYIINNTIAGNNSDNYGGAVSIGCYADSALFLNNIIGNNTATVGGDQFFINNTYYIDFYNNDIEGGFADIYFDDIYNGVYDTTNIDEDPLFVDAPGGDFSLEPCSPCINTGNNFPGLPPVDLDGNPRIFDIIVDMGAFEYQYVQTIIENIAEGVCIGDSLFLEGAWQTTAGVYTDTLAGVLHCDSIVITDLVINALPVVYLGVDTTILDNGTVTLDAGAGFVSYLWSDASSNQTLLVDGSVTGLGTFQYYVVIEDGNGCTNSDTILITVDHYNGILNADLNTIKVYPNPNNGQFFIETQNASVEIFDINGHVVYLKEFAEYSKEMVDLSTFTKGIYFLRMITEEVVYTEKIVIN